LGRAQLPLRPTLDDATDRKPRTVFRERLPDVEGTREPLARRQSPVTEHDAREALRALRRKAQADQRPPVLADQCDVLEIECLHPMANPRDLPRVAVVAALIRL